MSGARLDLDLSGLGVTFHGMPGDLADEMRRTWPAFAVTSTDPDPIVVDVSELGRPLTPGEAMLGGVEIEASGAGLSVRRDEGEMTCDPEARQVAVRLASGNPRRRLWGLVNLLAVAVARRLLGRGGGALHAAGIVVDERAFLLVGAEGAGKTTWARAAGAVGLPVISDDIVFVDSGRGRLEAIGTPIRDREIAHSGPGRWPVAALLVPRHGTEAALLPVSRLRLETALSANLLYVAASWRDDPRVPRAIEAIAEGAPARTLVFRPDGSWVEVLRGWTA